MAVRHSYLEFIKICIVFFFNDTATTEIYTLSLHDALPIYHLHWKILSICNFSAWRLLRAMTDVWDDMRSNHLFIVLMHHAVSTAADTCQ